MDIERPGDARPTVLRIVDDLAADLFVTRSSAWFFWLRADSSDE